MWRRRRCPPYLRSASGSSRNSTGSSPRRRRSPGTPPPRWPNDTARHRIDEGEPRPFPDQGKDFLDLRDGQEETVPEGSDLVLGEAAPCDGGLDLLTGLEGGPGFLLGILQPLV